jgi:hypothetical protein
LYTLSLCYYLGYYKRNSSLDQLTANSSYGLFSWGGGETSSVSCSFPWCSPFPSRLLLLDPSVSMTASLPVIIGPVPVPVRLPVSFPVPVPIASLVPVLFLPQLLSLSLSLSLSPPLFLYLPVLPSHSPFFRSLSLSLSLSPLHCASDYLSYINMKCCGSGSGQIEIILPVPDRDLYPFQLILIKN